MRELSANGLVIAGVSMTAAAGWLVAPSLGLAVAGVAALILGIALARTR